MAATSSRESLRSFFTEKVSLVELSLFRDELIRVLKRIDSSSAPDSATYITQTASADLTAEQALSSLGSGIMFVTTTTGVVTSLGPTAIVQGDILYGSASQTLVVLAKNASATRYLSNTGSSNNPAWAQVALATGVSGTLPVGNGGTGITTATQGDIIYASRS